MWKGRPPKALINFKSVPDVKLERFLVGHKISNSPSTVVNQGMC